MGMFDEYVPRPALRCPRCDAALRDFQGKDGPCAIFIWSQGVAAPVGQSVDADCMLPSEQAARFRLPPRFEIYTQCHGCGLWVSVTGFCDHGTWTRCTFGRHVDAVAVQANPIPERWRQCTKCTEAWEEEDDSVELSGCPRCGSLTKLAGMSLPK